MRMKKMAVFLSFILILSLLTVGCSNNPSSGGNSEPNTPSDKKDVLVVGQGADAVSLDPHATNDQPSSRIAKQIYETLVTQDENMELQPALADSWESIDDLTFEFKLKKGVKFHNGEAFTANDVKFTLLRGLDSPHIGHIIGSIDPNGIQIIDDYTIRISTKEPFAPLLAHLAHTATAILNEKAVNEFGDDYGQHPIGTGPYKFDKWINGDKVELVRFEDYHGEAPAIQRVIFRNIPENTNRTIELETGGIDIAYEIPPTDVSRVEDNPDLILQRNMNLSTTYLGFNCNKEHFKDVRVRQAINYAVDMEAIVKSVYKGVGAPSKGPLGPNVWASNQKLKPYEFNVEKAKKLMTEAGYPDGFKTSIWTNDNQQRMDVAEIVQNQLKAINIDAEVKVVEWGAFLDGTTAGEHDMFILGWVTVTGDPDYGLYPLFHSSQHGAGGNRCFYSNSKVDELLDKGRTSVDPAVREKAYMEVQQIIRDEAPWVFTWLGEDLAGVRSNVKGFKQHPAGHHKVYTVNFE
ncbi:glutathione ABC transporter substrate-binding protein [Inediibacterium massiliense]|uniref:glutathione ABC transporter substrate-binding protein n=1 Tax=Inediibacterium massiliense TaxID=1658111 RepID=UPI0006B56454|nr:glutathione ABC transporter substrate-binding protein [Inediibacterium massiliense]